MADFCSFLSGRFGVPFSPMCYIQHIKGGGFMALRKISAQKLQEVLRLHQLWLNDQIAGRPANLQCADLLRAKLQGADLQGADLRGANLFDAYLSGTNLSGANLRSANLFDAYLSGTNLSGADLRDADLRRANLRDADLRSALCDPSVQNAWNLAGSKWLRTDIPWWLGHEDQGKVILCDQ